MKRFMKLARPWAIGLLLSVISFAQTPAQLADPKYPSQFNDAYWLAQPAPVRALDVTKGNGDNSNEAEARRTGLAISLATQGYKVDVPIMVWGWDPYKVMNLRKQFGYTWVPNALQAPVGAAPGLSGPGIVPYDPNNPPGGAIKVSTNIADYPPFDPPVVVPPPASVTQGNWVGPSVFVGGGGNMYSALAGDPTPDGTRVNTPNGVFLKRKVQTPFGFSVWYEKQ